MLKLIKKPLYNRNVLIGRPNLTLKNITCGNITCNKRDKFKKYKEDMFQCECGYLAIGDFEIEATHKVKFFCGTKTCPESKKKMDKGCLTCEFIGER